MIVVARVSNADTALLGSSANRLGRFDIPRNRLTRAVGEAGRVELGIVTRKLGEGDTETDRLDCQLLYVYLLLDPGGFSE